MLTPSPRLRGERAARIAFVDRGVGLKEIVIGTGIDITIARRHDAERNRAAEPNGLRSPAPQSPTLRLLGIAELHRRKGLLGLDPHHRDIGFGISADKFGLESRAVD